MTKLILVFGLLFGLNGCFSGVGANYNTGIRTGTIVGMSYQGVFCKGWSVYFNTGGILNSSKGSTFTNQALFTVSDQRQDLINKIQGFQEQNIPVTLFYREWWTAPACFNGNYEIIDVKQITNK